MAIALVSPLPCLSAQGGSGFAEAPMVECLRVGIGSVSGRLLAVKEGRLILLRDGAREALPIEEFRELAFAVEPVGETPPPWTVWTDGSGRLAARRLGAAADGGALEVTGYGWRLEGLPLGAVRALASRRTMAGPAEARAQFEEARRAPPASADLVMLAGPEGSRVVSCVIEAAREDGLAVALGGAERRLPWDAVRWAVLAEPGSTAAPGGHAIELNDGTRLIADEIALTGGVLSGRRGPAALTVERERLARIRLRTDAYRYLSDLEPASVVTEPHLDVVWPPRMDRAISGGPLRLGARLYPEGIGMHPRTEMTFDLDGTWRELHATVGIDDAAEQLGRAAFRVMGDGVTLAQVGPIAGGEEPVALGVAIAGVRRLTLVADFGGPAALSGNLADWAAARVVR